MALRQRVVGGGVWVLVVLAVLFCGLATFVTIVIAVDQSIWASQQDDAEAADTDSENAAIGGSDELCDTIDALDTESTTDLLRALRMLGVDTDAQSESITACLEPTTPATKATPNQLGTWWDDFQKAVVTPLTPIATFVGISALVIIALGRLAAFLPVLRDPQYGIWQRKSTRVAAWVTGFVLALVVPILAAVVGMWISARGGPADAWELGRVPDFVSFVRAIVAMPGWWWWVLAALAAGGVWVWSFVFASRPRVSVKLTVKGDGTGLDTSRIVAAIDGMAGQANRGIEIPVGTDITTAASEITQISTNKGVAAVQTALVVILGTSPWQLSIESESDKAVSISISRNGALIKAKRIALLPGNPLLDVTEIQLADRLAALVAGELVAQLRTRYAHDYDPKLYGASIGEAIALQFLTSSALAESGSDYRAGVSMLERAVELDPSNRAAWTSLANFRYRNPANHTASDPKSHRDYRTFLLEAIRNELHHIDAPGAVPDSGAGSPATAMPQEVANKSEKGLKSNALLPRLLQAFAAASANLHAITGDGPDQDDEWTRWLRLLIAKGKRDEHELTLNWARRRQLLLIDEFRRIAWVPGAQLPLPAILDEPEFADEKSAWESARQGTDFAGLFERENAALRVCGDFDHDPAIAYALACYRVTRWLEHAIVRIGGRMPVEISIDFTQTSVRAAALKAAGALVIEKSTALKSAPSVARHPDLVFGADTLTTRATAVTEICAALVSLCELATPLEVRSASARDAAERAILGVREITRSTAEVIAAEAALRTDVKQKKVAAAECNALETASAKMAEDARALGHMEADSLALRPLLRVAAMSAGNREWFPIDPEMVLIRDTAIVPAELTPAKEQKTEAPDPTQDSLANHLKRLLAHLAGTGSKEDAPA